MKLEHREQRIVLEELLGAVRQESERVERLEQAIRDAVPEWSLAEVVTALQAMRGIDLITAVTVLAEIGDLSRFQNPRELMGYLGLVPSESSTGDTINRGGITKAGNGRVRKAASISLGLLAFMISKRSPRTRAADCKLLVSTSATTGLLGLERKAIGVTAGTNSCSNSSRFAATSMLRLTNPVRFPPGWLKLATRPISTGSLPIKKTIGIVGVTFLAASADAVVFGMAITAT
jgi:hypothetical protein